MFKIEKQFVYRVQEGDTFTSICKNFNTSKNNILRNNNDIPIYVGECLEIKVNEYVTHIVKPTETIAKIAQKYNTTEENIKRWNNLESDKLYIGQIIKVYNCT